MERLKAPFLGSFGSKTSESLPAVRGSSRVRRLQALSLLVREPDVRCCSQSVAAKKPKQQGAGGYALQMQQLQLGAALQRPSDAHSLRRGRGHLRVRGPGQRERGRGHSQHCPLQQQRTLDRALAADARPPPPHRRLE